MELIEIDVRVHLDRLRVIRTDDGVIAGSADEPYLWVVFLKVDGTTVQETAPQNAEVFVKESSPAPGNLGPASQGVAAGRSVAIPPNIGTFETTLRGATGAMLSLTKFATLAVAVGALEHDESRTQDIRRIHRIVIDESKKRLDRELRRIVRDAIEGNPPDAEEVRERLEAVLGEAEITEIVDDAKSELLGEPINILNQDVFVGSHVEMFSFATLLANSLSGIDFEAEMTRQRTGVTVQGGGLGGPERKARYRLHGAVERTDIREPPTLGLARFADHRVRACARGVGKKAWYRERAADGTWSSERAVGAGLLSSGPAIAASADGSRVYTVGRGLDDRIWVHWGSGHGWKRLFDRRFARGAGVACSSDGKRVFIMSTDRDGKVAATFNLDGGRDWTTDWFSVGVNSVASPALACSANGSKLFLITLGEDRCLYQTIFDVRPQGLDRKITVRLESQTFRSAPACACSDDGRQIWFAACGDDGRFRINKPKLEKGETSIWTEFGGEFASAPALACSPDGRTIDIAGIDMDLRMRHRFSTDAGETWPKRGAERWEVLAENAAWF